MEINKKTFSIKVDKKSFSKLPETAGVYTFWKNDKPIYIGKSVNLKSRLNSYLLLNLGVKTRKMVSEAKRVTFIEVFSELESLLLEASLVHTYKPKYNILLKDDKHALYIEITKEEFPRVITSRKNGDYGPFPSSANVKTILKMVRRVFPYSDHKLGKKPCLYSHIGLCNPCPNAINSKESKRKYLNNIRNIKLVLSRKFNIVRKDLEKRMQKLSKEQKYEEAQIVREQIKALDYITQKKISTEKFLENPNLSEDIKQMELESFKNFLNNDLSYKLDSLRRIECFDIAHLSGSSATASMVTFINGVSEKEYYRHFKIRQSKKQSDYDSMREIAKRRIKNIEGWGKPDIIIVDGGLGQVKIFNDAFNKLSIPVVGIAKHPDRLVSPSGAKVRLKGQALELVSRIRDEAHRFARRLHHKLISKSLLA